MLSSLSQRWSEEAITTLSEQAMEKLSKEIEDHAILVTGDNLVMRREQRIHNRNSLNELTASTAYSVPLPPPSADSGREYRRLAVSCKTITFKNIVDPKHSSAAPPEKNSS